MFESTWRSEKWNHKPSVTWLRIMDVSFKKSLNQSLVIWRRIVGVFLSLNQSLVIWRRIVGVFLSLNQSLVIWRRIVGVFLSLNQSLVIWRRIVGVFLSLNQSYNITILPACLSVIFQFAYAANWVTVTRLNNYLRNNLCSVRFDHQWFEADCIEIENGGCFVWLD